MIQMDKSINFAVCLVCYDVEKMAAAAAAAAPRPAAAAAAAVPMADELNPVRRGIQIDEEPDLGPRIVFITNDHKETIATNPVTYRYYPDHHTVRETIDARFVVLCPTLQAQLEGHGGAFTTEELKDPVKAAAIRERLKQYDQPKDYVDAYVIQGSADSVKKIVRYLKIHQGKTPPAPSKPLKSKSLRECGFSQDDATFANGLWSVDKEQDEGDYSHRPLFKDLWAAANQGVIKPLQDLLAAKFATVYKGVPVKRLGALCYSGHTRPELAGNTAEWYRWYSAYKASKAPVPAAAASSSSAGGGGGGTDESEAGSGGVQKRIKREPDRPDTKRDSKAPYAAAAAASSSYDPDLTESDEDVKIIHRPAGVAMSSAAAAASAPAGPRRRIPPTREMDQRPASAAGLPVSATSLRSASSKK